MMLRYEWGGGFGWGGAITFNIVEQTSELALSNDCKAAFVKLAKVRAWDCC